MATAQDSAMSTPPAATRRIFPQENKSSKRRARKEQDMNIN
jgi:hypothetical protein